MSKILSIKKHRVEYQRVLQSLEKVRNEIFEIFLWTKRNPYLKDEAINRIYSKLANLVPRANNIKEIEREIENANSFIHIFYNSLHEELKKSLNEHFCQEISYLGGRYGIKNN